MASATGAAGILRLYLAHAVSIATFFFMEKVPQKSNISMILQVTKENSSTVQGVARVREELNMIDSYGLKLHNKHPHKC